MANPLSSRNFALGTRVAIRPLVQFKELRRILQHVVLAGLPAAGCATDVIDTGDCEDNIKRTIYIDTPADPPLQFRIDACQADVDACLELCSMTLQRVDVFASPTACAAEFESDKVAVKVEYTVWNGGLGCPVEGRRPAGLALPQGGAARTAAGAWLAEAAWLEAASIHAFLHLARELSAHGAPEWLVKCALGAARDEVRHTVMMTHLATRYGAVPAPAHVALPDARSLEALAIENAAEGCVRETWGAVLALWQSRTARDPQIRAAFALIARDEIRHAGLAWAVDAWARPQLDEAARARVDAARDAAARELLDGHALEANLALGLPHGTEARALLARTHDSLWNTGGRS